MAGEGKKRLAIGACIVFGLLVEKVILFEGLVEGILSAGRPIRKGCPR